MVEEFKQVMGKLATGVTVITTSFENKLSGLTVNSFTSVSLQPSLVSFCLNKNSMSYTQFIKSNNFAINILSVEQKKIAQHFAQHHADKFLDIEYLVSIHSGCPLITGAICWIECKKLFIYEGGDHIILIGEVINSSINNDLMPLIYYAKQYCELK